MNAVIILKSGLGKEREAMVSLDRLIIQTIFQPVVDYSWRRDGNIELAKMSGDAAGLTLAAIGLRAAYTSERLMPILEGAAFAIGLGVLLRTLLAFTISRKSPWSSSGKQPLFLLRITGMMMTVVEFKQIVETGERLYIYCLVMNILLVSASYFASCAPSLKGSYD